MDTYLDEGILFAQGLQAQLHEIGAFRFGFPFLGFLCLLLVVVLIVAVVIMQHLANAIIALLIM
jgi:hypothetical protein